MNASSVARRGVLGARASVIAPTPEQVDTTQKAGDARRPRRVLVLVTEDWFAASHFLPVLRALDEAGYQVRVATRVDQKGEVLRAAGCALVPFNFERGDLRPVRDIGTAARLLALLWRERPDAIHVIALKPITLAALVYLLSPARHMIMHLTGVGYAGTGSAMPIRLVYGAVRALISGMLKLPSTWLMVENPDDMAGLATPGASGPGRVTILGGAGVDPAHFAVAPLAGNAVPRAAFVGRMVWTKGVDVLVEAHSRLLGCGVDLDLRLCGDPDTGNPRAIPGLTLEAWRRLPHVSLSGHVSDVRSVWRGADIAVVPSRGGEGLPRAMLEAAACGRPIIASDVPGCRYFVRDGVEGLLVPAEDPDALAAALAKLAGDRALREAMGAAARARLMSGFTERHVISAVQTSYAALFAGD